MRAWNQRSHGDLLHYMAHGTLRLKGLGQQVKATRELPEATHVAPPGAYREARSSANLDMPGVPPGELATTGPPKNMIKKNMTILI